MHPLGPFRGSDKKHSNEVCIGSVSMHVAFGAETSNLCRPDKPLVFLLAEIGPRRVVLVREGERFELKAPIQSGIGRIKLTRNIN